MDSKIEHIWVMGASRRKTTLVTGGAGFIGSAFVRLLLEHAYQVVVLDALTYAGHRENLTSCFDKIQFVEGNICDSKLLGELFDRYDFDYVVNFAAESHVDRSIKNPLGFMQTNVLGVFALLEASLRAFERRTPEGRTTFRFLQVSTDEVFGSLGEQGTFSEESPYLPNSPYSASKASADHLVRAWFHTYGLPVLTTNCSNNYGPRQFPEKLIPFMIDCALAGRPLPVYGDGRNVRDWIHMDDHCAGVLLALEKGVPGQTYCFGGRSERRNIDVVKAICKELDLLRPKAKSYSELIAFVEDRRGHDWRYAIESAKAEKELGFKCYYRSFEDGLKQTVRWYLDHDAWIKTVKEKIRGDR